MTGTSPGHTTIPLRTLPSPLPSRCDWLTERDPSRPSILSHHAGDTAEFVLHAPAGATLYGSVRLAEQAWRDTFGLADVTVDVEGASWSGRLFTANEGHSPAEHAVELEIPPTSGGPAHLRFSIATHAPRGCQRIDRVFWRDLRLEVPRPESASVRGGPEASDETIPTGRTQTHTRTGRLSDAADAALGVAPGSGTDAAAGRPRHSAASLAAREILAAVPRGDRPAAQPFLSIVMPVCDPDPTLLRTTLDSVHAQSAGGWELCMTDDASTDPEVLRMLAAETERYPDRIVVRTHEVRSGISAATNTALEVARGTFVVMLDHDDLLHPDAIRLVLEVIEREDPDAIYSDDEIEFETGRKVTSHKPGFSLTMIRGLMYTHHLSAYRRSAIEDIDGLRSAFDGSQDYDMFLRLLDAGPKVAHIPQVLYTWRAHALSMAGNPHSKPFAYARGLAALNEHVDRSEVGGAIVYGGHPGRYRHLPPWPESTTATVVAAVSDAEGLHGLVETLGGWFQDDGSTPAVVVGTVASLADAVRAALAGLAPDAATLRVVSVDDQRPGHALAAAADAVRTDVALLLQRPVHRLSSRTIRTLGSHARLPDVHAAGLRIVDAQGRVESTGIVVRDGAPQRILAGGQGNDHGPSGIGRFTRAVAALDDVIVTTRTDLERLGGLDGDLGDLAITDYCLRGNRTGSSAVLLADLLVGRPATALPTVVLDDLAAFAERWSPGDEVALRADLTPLALGDASSKTTIREVLRPA